MVDCGRYKDSRRTLNRRSPVGGGRYALDALFPLCRLPSTILTSTWQSKMDLQYIAFFTLAAAALISAVMVITRRNAVHSVMWLIVTLFSVGGIYLMQRAEFLFAVQIILYVGGIMVLFLFVVMLVNIDVAVKQAQFSRQWPLALVTVGLLAAELVYGFYVAVHKGLNLPEVTAATATATPGNTELVAQSLYQTYALPVEIASILLLVAMVGAVLMAKKQL